MTLPLDEDSRPPYLQAAAALRDAILTGEFTSGERLPSANVLGERFGVSGSTVQNALRVLKQEGLVYSQLGRGSFVSSAASGSDAPDASPVGADGEEPGADWPADLIRNDDGRPPYVQVADVLRRDIAEGTYPPGSQLPPAREIQERFQVANSTAQNAYRSLKQEGLVYSVKGRGIFVRQASTSRSCREFHWSAPGKRSSIQNHCGLAASTREVGVSALYSSILAGLPGPS